MGGGVGGGCGGGGGDGWVYCDDSHLMGGGMG